MLKVLIADDEMPIRQWLEFCIQKIEGYQVVGTAAHGAEGFSLFRKTAPDIIITDIRMPVMDGLEMMKMIQNVNPCVYTIILTSHEDFSYARQALSLGASEYILKTEISDDSLRQLLEKAAEAIGKPSSDLVEKGYEEISNRNHFLRSLVIRKQPVIIGGSMLAEYGIPLEKKPYYAMNLFHSSGQESRIHKPEGAFLTQVMKIPVDSRNTMLVGNVNVTLGVRESRIREMCTQYLSEIMEEFPCIIGISNLYSDPAYLAKAMIQAKNRSAQSFYYPRKRIFDIQDEVQSSKFNGEAYKIMFNKELLNQNYEGALDVKRRVMEAVRICEPMDPEQIKDVYLFFITSFLHMTKEDVNQVEQLVDKKREVFAEVDSLDSLDECLDQFFREHGSILCRTREYSHAIRNAINYLEEHYADSITQTEVAEYVGISSEYLSRIFKEETGVKFIVFLNNLRLKHAIRLLENTNLKVYEIAEQVGYSNLSYFSTVFKKNVGQNPFEYKNSAGRKDE